jgi:hypothetical protein
MSSKPRASHAQSALTCDLALGEVAKNPSVTEIYLGRRALVYISDLTRYKQLEALWLNDNSLTALHGFDCNPTLQAIYAHNNKIYTLAGSLQNIKYLRSLSLYNNTLRDLNATLPFIRHLQYLVALDLFGNPLANEPNYRLLVVWTFPSLHVLDRHEVTDEERLAAVKKFGKVSQDLVAFGKRTTKWNNPPPIPLATLSATASDMYKELERVRARVEAEEAAKATGAAPEPPLQRSIESKHVRNDYVTVMKWSNPAVEFAAVGSGSQRAYVPAQATAALAASSLSASGPSSTITLDQAKYSQCVIPQSIPQPLFSHCLSRPISSHLPCFHARYEQRKAAANATSLAPVKLQL